MRCGITSRPVQMCSGELERRRLTRPTHALLRASISFIIMEYNIVFVVVVLVFSLTVGIQLDESEWNTNGTQPLALQNFEVPDSSLLLLDRLHVKQFTMIQERARKAKPKPKPKPKPAKATTPAKQTEVTVAVTNITSTTTPLPSSDESESESRPCTCSLGVCKCCTGLVMDLFNQKACMKVAYHPGDFAFDVAMSWNDRVLYENSLSGKNPRPICIHPPRMNNLKVCAKFYNVFFPGRNFHFCLAMTGQWRALELFNVAFDCLRMGANGIAMIKPEDAGGLTIPNPQGGVDAVVDSGDDIEDYDENVVKSLLDIFDRR